MFWVGCYSVHGSLEMGYICDDRTYASSSDIHAAKHTLFQVFLVLLTAGSVNTCIVDGQNLTFDIWWISYSVWNS